jgi:hypothetical protein
MNQILATNNDINLIKTKESEWQISSIMYMIMIIVVTIIILISLIQFVYWVLNISTPGYKFSYKKPLILLLIWVFLIPMMFIVITLINLFK